MEIEWELRRCCLGNGKWAPEQCGELQGDCCAGQAPGRSPMAPLEIGMAVAVKAWSSQGCNRWCQVSTGRISTFNITLAQLRVTEFICLNWTLRLHSSDAQRTLTGWNHSPSRPFHPSISVCNDLGSFKRDITKDGLWSPHIWYLRNTKALCTCFSMVGNFRKWESLSLYDCTRHSYPSHHAPLYIKEYVSWMSEAVVNTEVYTHMTKFSL